MEAQKEKQDGADTKGKSKDLKPSNEKGKQRDLESPSDAGSSNISQSDASAHGILPDNQFKRLPSDRSPKAPKAQPSKPEVAAESGDGKAPKSRKNKKSGEWYFFSRRDGLPESNRESAVLFNAADDFPLSTVPRNEVGVQLLSSGLHSQIFPSTSLPPPPVSKRALNISQQHLSQHGLLNVEASTLPQTSFTLPPLQGKDLGEHFWNLGREVAQPWLGYAHELAAAEVPQPPHGVEEAEAALQGEEAEKAWLNAVDGTSWDSILRMRPGTWRREPGWTKYSLETSTDGSVSLGSGVPVQRPDEEDSMLVFDVETMVAEGPYAVMATAASPRAWYSWLSPWLLGHGPNHTQREHLIPLGSSKPRIIVGHNVGYDRARVLEEYSLGRTQTRWLDTMSLHIATRGISSPQRPAWTRHARARAERRAEKLLAQQELEEGTRAAIRAALEEGEYDENVLAGLDLAALAPEGSGGTESGSLGVPSDIEIEDGDGSARSAAADAVAAHQWQDVTSKNGLADVAELHCGIRLSKALRDVFVDGTPRETILANLDALLGYCARDVFVTHAVFQKVWPAFVKACPHPVTAAGVLGMGSAFLPVDDQWEDYRAKAHGRFEALNGEVKKRLVGLAQKLKEDGTQGIGWTQAASFAARRIAESEGHAEGDHAAEKAWWENDPWLSQLDWSPKRPKRSRVVSAPPSAEASKGSATPGDETADPNEDRVAGSEASNPPEKFTPALAPGERLVPRWYRDAVLKSKSGIGPRSNVAPLVLRLRLDGRALRRDPSGGWVAPGVKDEEELEGSPLTRAFAKKGQAKRVTSAAGDLGSQALEAIWSGQDDEEVRRLLKAVADQLVESVQDGEAPDESLRELDWTVTLVRDASDTTSASETSSIAGSAEKADPNAMTEPEWWPKWYWDLHKSATGQLELSTRSKIAPLLLNISWRGCPLFHSREHGWVYRHSPALDSSFTTRQRILSFTHPADQELRTQAERNAQFYKVPHHAGEEANVGSPFSKGFVPFFENGTLRSDHPDEGTRGYARAALEMNAMCSYWLGVRDRVDNQLVVYDGQAGAQMGFEAGASGARGGEAEKVRSKGMILPQVITMGTVTRRAIEKTWLTASNAKKNRVGSELKAMVKAPPGWSIVGADVDSEELWICAVMGDAQFGVHGATAVGWMTLEGSKAAGTDLHSKTASILGTSRNQAKVFNYSRIYGAGIRHATQLLLQANPAMPTDKATKLAKELYVATKGLNTHSPEYFGRKFWFGGTESYVFNKLEGVAISAEPRTPALDCGVTAALRKRYLPRVTMADGRVSEDYMPSRINWVVQSSGVDYLHLLMAAMEHLCSKYDIEARFMLSVHDEVRYLARDQDAARAALALQIANLWTRAMFAFKLEMDNLPQGCAFFSQVDVDKVLRKEVDDPCITPSHPDAIPPGKAYDVEQILEMTSGGSLHADGRAMEEVVGTPDHSESGAENGTAPTKPTDPKFPPYVPSMQQHRAIGAQGLYYLEAQAADEIGAVRLLHRKAQEAENRELARERIERLRSGPSEEAEVENEGEGEADSTAQTDAGKKSAEAPKKRRAKATSQSIEDWADWCAENADSQSDAGKSKRTTRKATDGTSNALRAPRRPAAGKENNSPAPERAITSSLENRSFSTCAHTSRQVVLHDDNGRQSDSTHAGAQLPPSVLALSAQLPPRPVRSRVPFFRSSNHTSPVRWELYRPLLRACPRDLPTLRIWIRAVFRKRARCTSLPRTREMIEEGKEVSLTC